MDLLKDLFWQFGGFYDVIPFLKVDMTQFPKNCRPKKEN